GFFIQQQDRKDLIIKYFTHQFSNPAQGRVQVERGVDHIGHLEQKWLDLGLKIGLDGGWCQCSLMIPGTPIHSDVRRKNADCSGKEVRKEVVSRLGGAVLNTP